MNPNDNKNLISPDIGNWSSHNNIRILIQLTATVGGVILCFQMTFPFLSSLAWALALAVLFIPIHQKINRKLKQNNLSAIITSAIAIFVVVIPIILITIRVVLEAGKGATLIMTKVESREWQNNLQELPYIGRAVLWLERQLDIPSSVVNLTSWLTTQVTLFLRSSLIQIVIIVLTFYLLFFFLRDHKQILRTLRRFSPFCGSETNALFKEVSNTIRATVFGTIAVAAVQGSLTGLMFWILDLPAPLLWGTVMTVLSIIPLLGAYVIWIPTSLYLALEGNWLYAIILASWGTFFIGTIDNILHPILINKKLKLHTVLAFISLAGGILVFGASGVILGPITATSSAFLVHIWRFKARGKQ